MNFISVALVTILLLEWESLGAFTPLQIRWYYWKLRYNKKYSSLLDEKVRFRIWAKNVKQIEDLNKRFLSGEFTFSQKVNEFADLTWPEFQQIMLKTRKLKALPAMPPVTVGGEVRDTVDWRSKGWVTKVKHQGLCGSGWAFATIAAVEAHYFNHSGRSVNLSEQLLMDCSSQSSCEGGIISYAFLYLSTKGSVRETDYMYEATRNYCRRAGLKTLAFFHETRLLTPNDERNLKIALAVVGPIAVSFEVTPKLQFYQSGVFWDQDCHFGGPTNHAVLLVGYGFDPLWGDYWLGKNSWGTQWGDGGYFKIARNTLYNCEIASFPLYPAHFH